MLYLAGVGTAACSGSGAPQPTLPVSPTIKNPVIGLHLRIAEGEATLSSGSGRDQRASVVYHGCWDITNLGDEQLTLVKEVQPLGSDGNPYPVTPIPDQGTPLFLNGYSLGCGASTFDYDFTHPVATRYQLIVNYRSTSGVTGTATDTAAISRSTTLPPRVVISEFRTPGQRKRRSIR
jgi:hypothetical protein